MNALKRNGWTVKKAGHRYSIDGRIKPVLLIQNKAFWGVTIDGNGRQLGRAIRNICRASQQ